MTNSNPSPTPNPAPITYLKYGIIWTLTNGNATYRCEGSLGGTDNVNMQRGDNQIPIIPECGGEIGANDGRNSTEGGEGEGGEEEVQQLSWFHTEYKWNNVEISYHYDSEEKKALKDFNVDATVYSLIETPGGPDDGSDEPQHTFNQYESFRVNRCTIISEDPNSGGTWVFPDDYDVQVDPNYPKQYGGVILSADSTPGEYKAGETYRCGIDDGPNEDGKVAWINSNNKFQETFSAYNYVDVFDDVDFSYISRNTYDNYKMAIDESFPMQPMDEDMKDANGLAAPVYPMNAITSFIPDPRESVKVTYKVSLDIDVLDKNGKVIKNAVVENPDITITQIVEQDTSDYINQLSQLQAYCQFSNPKEFKLDELSPNYNYDYPYTMVRGYEGIDGFPTERGDDSTDGKKLKRGDVYIDNIPGGNRYTWSVGDIPETFTIIDGGSGYEDNDRAMAIYSFPTDHSFDKERYPNGRPPRNFSVSNLTEIPVELYVEIETENGKIISAKMPENTDARGWKDGDTIRILGGKNNSELRVNISEGSGWSRKFINKY